MISWSIRGRIAEGIRKVAFDCLRRSRRTVPVIALVGSSTLLWLPGVEANGNGASPGRPLKLSCQTTFAFTPTGSIHIEGRCHYSHLGLTSVVSEQIIIPQPNGTINIVNTSVYTAANGDELFATVAGTGAFTATGEVVFSGVETYTGGTGRFADASGSATIAGGAAFTSATTGVGHFSGEGKISY